jgi:hypothetical protein
MDQEILTLPEHLSSQPVFSGVRVTKLLEYAMLESFNKKKRQPGYNYIVLGRDNPYVFIVL